MRPILFALSGLALLAAPVAGQAASHTMPVVPQLSDSAAREGNGARVAVTGTVVQAKSHTHDGTGYLNFGGRYPAQTFSVIIPDSAMARFGDLTRFEGHQVRVTGTVWLRDGKSPAMTVTDPSALELLP